ncbi:MAG TPA: xanthine dehydrogenase family protein molybdopterin-binding subunit [Alphaproteobacteria bacterium]|nr:xanthine dehydrogenase family protein molybdopterin-binding subunit [Alphaproteobacteria bacterium]
MTDREPPAAPWIGRSRRRVEDARLVTGQGRFVGDIVPAGCLHAAFLRSPHARAAITALDTRAAEVAPGVVAVFSGAQVAGLGDLPVNPLVETLRVPPFPILAQGSVEAVGQPVAAVVAETLAAALDAAELIEVDYDPAPAVLGSAADAPTLFPEVPENEAALQSWHAGDVEAAFAAADEVVRVSVQHARLAPLTLEPRAVLAEWDEGTGALTVRLSTQTPHRARADLAAIIGLAPERLRVIAPDVGGAFGMKASLYPEEVLVVWAAARLRRPLRWTATRAEDMAAASHGRGAAIRGELALARDGTMLAVRACIEAPLGHWLPFSAVVPARNAGRILPGPYAVPAVEITARAHVSNTAPVGIYRGAGRPEAALLMERLADEGARALGLDALALRRRNLIAADRFPHATPTGETFDSGDFDAVLTRAQALADYQGLRAEQARRRKAGALHGIGVAFYVEPSGQGLERAHLRLEPGGTVMAATGTSAQGQGRETAFAQIVADTLIIPPEDICVIHGDTALTPPGIGALASRSTPIGGGALALAAEDLREQARSAAARLLQAEPQDVSLGEDGFARADQPGASLSWAALAGYIARSGEAVMEARHTFETPGEAWGCGAAIAAVAIDAETGTPTIERFVWVDDAGTVVNPMLVEGQLMGGIAQGLGEALMERIVYDGDGQLLTGSLMDYAVPRAADMPAIEFDRVVTPSPMNPLGVKGVGEAGTIGAPSAIMGAVLDALQPLGVRHIDMPLTSERIWRAIKDAEARGQEREMPSSQRRASGA